jgi:hypothetical protein
VRLPALDAEKREPPRRLGRLPVPSEREQAAQFDDRFRVVVDATVADPNVPA